ncbi:MAG: hypothetical protein JWQ20_1071, partial [Conexibacter sp.]|nr:hypothetical protein [Conexibacter sp.]
KFSAPPQRQEDVRVDEEPPSFSHPRLYTQFQFRTLGHPTGGRQPTKRVPVSIESPTRSDVGGLQAFGAVGERVTIGVVWSPLVRIDGDVRAAGRDANGTIVVHVTHSDVIGHWNATVRPRCALCLGALTGRDPWQPLAGQLLTLVSAMALTGLAVVGLLRRRRIGAFAPEGELAALGRPLQDEPPRREVPAP